MSYNPVAAQPLTPNALISSLKSTCCPACGRRKKPEQTFCAKDYFALSPDQRSRLYDLLGEGYREAVEAAMATLGASKFLMPVGWIPKAVDHG